MFVDGDDYNKKSLSLLLNICSQETHFDCMSWNRLNYLDTGRRGKNSSVSNILFFKKKKKVLISEKR